MLSLDLFLDEPKKYKHLIDIEYPLECDNCKVLKNEIALLHLRIKASDNKEVKQPTTLEGWYK